MRHGQRSIFLGVVVPAVVLCALGSLSAAARPAGAAGVHKATVAMKEFAFAPARIELKVGEDVELTLKNEGQVAHDWMVGTDLVNTTQEKGFHKDLLALLKRKETGKQFTPERVGVASKTDGIKRISTGVEIEPGGEVRLRFVVPASAKGQWDMDCVLTGHYESGMKGAVVIR